MSRSSNGQLIERRLDFLQADDVGFFGGEPVEQLRLPGADAVDIPGCDFHCHAYAATETQKHREIDLVCLLSVSVFLWLFVAASDHDRGRRC